MSIPVFIRHADDGSDVACYFGNFEFERLESVAQEVSRHGVYIEGRGDYNHNYTTQLLAERKRVIFEIIFHDDN
jgi:hypothetical protein